MTNPVIRFHQGFGYEPSYTIDNYIVLRRVDGDNIETKLYDPKSKIVFGGRTLVPAPRYEDLSEEPGNVEE